MWRFRAPATILLFAVLAPAHAATDGLPGSASPLCRNPRLPSQVPGLGPAPVANVSCVGVRPGGVAEVGGGICTLNVLFRGSDGRRYIGTAGHCVIDEFDAPQEHAWKTGKGPPAYLPDLVSLGIEEGLGLSPVGSAATAIEMGRHRFGEAAYAFYADVNRFGQDFALIRLDPGIPYSPAVCYWGGPTGVYADVSESDFPTPSDLIVMRLFGHGQAVGALPARTIIGLVPVSAYMAAAWGPDNFGDSGSPVILEDGRSVGVLVGFGPTSLDPAQLAPVAIVRLGPAVARAEKVMGIKLTLLKAPLAP